MRIVAGTLGGRVIRAPRGVATRPTAEKVRAALFDILGPPGADLHVLDLFAGSGALGLEALSRGAASATFVDSARPALAALHANLAALDLAGRARVVAADVARFVVRPGPGPVWSWVFLDPPYALDPSPVLAGLLRARLTPDAVIAIEHAHRSPPPERVGFLIRTDLRRYGDTALSLYRPEPEPEPASRPAPEEP